MLCPPSCRSLHSHCGAQSLPPAQPRGPSTSRVWVRSRDGSGGAPCRTITPGHAYGAIPWQHRVSLDDLGWNFPSKCGNHSVCGPPHGSSLTDGETGSRRLWNGPKHHNLQSALRYCHAAPLFTETQKVDSFSVAANAVALFGRTHVLRHFVRKIQ